MPPPDRLKACRLVSHRGEHDNRQVLENTLPAFDKAYRAGVWGIEMDLRWTKDLHPVVFHDPDTRRLFGVPLRICQIDFKDLQARFPLIPGLEQVVANYGKKMHLMLEIKAETYPNPQLQCRRLHSRLSGLTPGQDYHLLSLTPSMFGHLTGFEPDLFLPIAEFNLPAVSRTAIQYGYGGVLGHYLLLTRGCRKRHARHGQKVGSGYIDSTNCLWRELNRGTQWIFSNQAARMQKIVDGCLRSHNSG
jgi:glycerophosphoryl diester phosphodiesterase